MKEPASRKKKLQKKLLQKATWITATGINVILAAGLTLLTGLARLPVKVNLPKWDAEEYTVVLGAWLVVVYGIRGAWRRLQTRKG